MKTIAIGDVHGCYNELKSLLEELESTGKYDPASNRLIFLGDYIDRGPDSRKVVKLVRSLQEENENVIALMGNHENMLLDYYENGDSCWLYNGGHATMDAYADAPEDFQEDMAWMETLPTHFQDENFFFVHAGIDPSRDIDDQDKDTLLWTRRDFINNPASFEKTVVFGHTPSIFVNDTTLPYYTPAGHIGIDTGCVYNGALTALILDGEDNCRLTVDVQQNIPANI